MIKPNKLLLCLTLLIGAYSNSIAQSFKDSLALDEVVVTGSRAPVDVRHLPLTLSTLSRPQIDHSYQQSLLPVLNEQVPGIFVTQRGMIGFGVSNGSAGAMKMRGIGGNPTTEMMVLVDGAPHYTGLMGHTVADLYQSLIADRVEVVRGPASMLYGSNAMGGVMNIITRKAQEEGLSNQIRLQGGSYGTINGEYAGSQRFGRFENMLGGSVSSTDGHRKNMHFEQYSLVDNMAFQISPHWSIRGAVNLTHFISHNPGAVSAQMTDSWMNIRRGMMSAGIGNHYEHMRGAVNYFLDWGNHKIDDGYVTANPNAAPTTFFFRLKDNMQGVNAYESFQLSSTHTLTVGLDYKNVNGMAWNESKSDGTMTEPTAGTKGYNRWHSTDEIAGYAQVRQILFDVLTLNAGLRYNYHSEAGSEWIPQIGLAYSPDHTGVLKANVSKGFRNPTLREMYLYPSAAEELKAERMWNYELSWHQALKNLTYGVNVFYADVDNLIETLPVDPKEYGARLHNFNTGTLHNWGVETEIGYRVNEHCQLNANYSYLHTSKEVTAAPRHKLYAGVNQRIRRFTLNAGAQWVGHLITTTARSTDHVENYLLLNLRTDYQALSWLNVFAKGDNLLAQSYETYDGFPMPRATVMLGLDIRF